MGISVGRAGVWTLVTVQADNTVPVARALARYLTQSGTGEVRFEPTLNWQERYKQIQAGEVDIAWICGWPYVQLAGLPDPPVELLAAPVMSGSRYQRQPVYFSDVVVRSESNYQIFVDLAGANWAVNEPGSQSGYHITRYHLATMATNGDFFQRVTVCGSHVAALDAVLAGAVDAAAIDSTVLEWLLSRRPELESRLRVIETLGPSPIPPLVVSTRLDRELRQTLQATLVTMYQDPEGASILAENGLERFVTVTDGDYDPIRRMAEAARHVVFNHDL